MNTDIFICVIREIRGLFTAVVFGYEPFLERFQVALFEIEVRPGDYFSPFIGSYPIDNLWRVGSEKSAVVFIERLAVFT